MSNGQEYTLTEAIHESESTTIYRGYRNADHLPVAIKRLKQDPPSSTDIAKLRYECAIAKSLDLPGVVKALGIEKVGTNLALIMEDADGRALSEVISSHKFSTNDVLRIALSVTTIIESVHRNGVIHMDVKPHNIIVDMDRLEAKLTDFGSATRLSQETQRLKSPASFEGTLAYMSPEQTGRMNRFIDSRTDLYSLGVTMYEMVTGVLPFQTTDLVELVHSHIARIPTPPHELSPSTPRVLSDIVMKLLAKVPDDRYLGAYGLKVDLAECLTQLQTSGQIAPFPLGRHDYVDELRIPQKLYGREAEQSTLLEAWERASQGTIELLLVSGYAGIGKSVLVHEIHKAIARGRGYFAAGKYDQLNRSTPYAAMMYAYRELIRDVLTEPSEALAGWKIKLEQALGPNGQILIDIIPELEFIIGPQPSVPPLGPTESQNRFNLIFQDFCRAFTAKEHPLVIFLDDLQWADPASLKFLQTLLTESDISNMLVIGAYRDNEVDESHIFAGTLAELRKSTAIVRSITLTPLTLPIVEQIVADTLSSEIERSAPLAKIIFDKTQGNPFFMHQFMRALHNQRLLSFDLSSRSWQWEPQRIREMKVTDNVVDFMAGNIRKLSQSTQRILTLAACIGHQFDLRTLSLVNDKSPRVTGHELWESLREGLVLPVDTNSRFLNLPTDSDMDGAEIDSDPAFNVSYRFLHDRVQQAAYSLIEDAHKQEVHLRVGRLMLSKIEIVAGDQSESDLFAIVGHLNRGAALISDPQERTRLSRLNFDAGKRAKAGSAHEAAADYFRAGASLLDQQCWENEYDLIFPLTAELAECEYLNGRVDAAEALFNSLLPRARTKLDQAHVSNLRILFYSTFARFADAVKCGLEALALLDVHIPEAPEQLDAMLKAELEELRVSLTVRSIAELADLPVASDPWTQTVLKTLANMTVGAVSMATTMGTLVQIKQINISIKHGNSDTSATAYMTHALLLTGSAAQSEDAIKPYKEGYEFAKLAIHLNEKFNNVSVSCRLHLLFAAMLHLFEPLRVVISTLARARQIGFESGDLIFLSYTCNHVISSKIDLGDDLESVDEEIDQNLALMQRTNEKITMISLVAAKQIVANLRGRTVDRHSWSDGSFDEASFVRTLEAEPAFVAMLAYYYIFKLQLSYIYGDYEAARPLIDLALKATTNLPDMFWVTGRVFYSCLTLVALYDAAPVAEKEQHMAMLRAHQVNLDLWAKLCPHNYEHKRLLVEAEVARVSGHEREAIDLYDRAIDAAKEHGFKRDEAMSSELCAKFYLSIGRTRYARAYMADAYHGYLAWGATAKVDDLVSKVPSLLPQAVALPAARNLRAPVRVMGSQTTSTSKLNTNLLDVEAVIRAAQAIAGEVVLENVVQRLMDIIIKNAGAQKGVLVLERENRLIVEATITVDPNLVKVGPPIPVEASAELPLTVVQYVARTREPVVLGDAMHEPRFASDPYMVSQSPKSILCLAMVHQGRTTGIFYLENKFANDAFTPARLELLKLLLAQAATAVENALLYARLQSRTEALLEAEERLKVEFAERARSEQARVALQEEIIRVQSDRLAELSTPIIPITDRIMVMPLIGMMDGERAQQVLSTALQGIQRSRAQVVIIDITGVKLVDNEVASTLISTASALRLLGAQAVITGIGPGVAQTLIGLQIDFGSIVTMGTLQSGIAYALKRTE